MDLNIKKKQNGLFVRMRTSLPISTQHVTGWSTESGWFYITVLDAISDSVNIESSIYNFPITNILATNSQRSTQIAFQLDREVENFEFYHAESPPEILLSLRFPINEVFAKIKDDKQIATNMNYFIPNRSSKYKRIRTGLFLVGSSLTIAGAMDMDNSNKMSWELPAGLIILAGTYFYDTVLLPKLKEDVKNNL